MNAKRLTLQDGKFQQVSASSIWCVPADWDPQGAPFNAGRFGVFVCQSEGELVCVPAGIWYEVDAIPPVLFGGYVYDPTPNGDGLVEVHLAGRFPVPQKSPVGDSPMSYPWDTSVSRLLCGYNGGASSAIADLLEELRAETPNASCYLLYLGDMINTEPAEGFVWDSAEFELSPCVYKVASVSDAANSAIPLFHRHIGTSGVIELQPPIAAPAPAPVVVNGMRVLRGVNQAGSAGAAVSVTAGAGRIYYIPCTGVSIVKALGYGLFTAASPSTNVHLGIYTDVAGAPGIRLAEVIVATGTTEGIRLSADFNIELDPSKRYWFAILLLSGRPLQALAPTEMVSIIGRNSAGVIYTHLRSAGGNTSLPSSYETSPGQTGAAPLILYSEYV